MSRSHASGRPVSKRIDSVVTRPLGHPQPAEDLFGFSTGTTILTLDGEIPVEHLCPGDRIITRSGARILMAISSTSVNAAYVIRPHTLGHGRPGTEITVGPHQEILLRDWRAKALYGSAEAKVPVSRLADGEYIAFAELPTRLFQLQFARDEVIYADGVEAPVAGAGF